MTHKKIVGWGLIIMLVLLVISTFIEGNPLYVGLVDTLDLIIGVMVWVFSSLAAYLLLNK